MKYFKNEATSTNGTLSINKQTLLQRENLKLKSNLGVGVERLGGNGMFPNSPIGNITGEIKSDVPLIGSLANERINEIVIELDNMNPSEQRSALVEELERLRSNDRNQNNLGVSNSAKRKNVYDVYERVVDGKLVSTRQEEVKVGYGFTSTEMTNLNLNYLHPENPLYPVYEGEDNTFGIRAAVKREKSFLKKGTRPEKEEMTPETRRYLGFPDPVPNNIHTPQIPNEPNENFPDTFEEDFYRKTPTNLIGSDVRNYRQIVSQENVHIMSGGLGYYSSRTHNNEYQGGSNSLGKYFAYNYPSVGIALKDPSEE